MGLGAAAPTNPSPESRSECQHQCHFPVPFHGNAAPSRCHFPALVPLRSTTCQCYFPAPLPLPSAPSQCPFPVPLPGATSWCHFLAPVLLPSASFPVPLPSIGAASQCHLPVPLPGTTAPSRCPFLARASRITAFPPGHVAPGQHRGSRAGWPPRRPLGCNDARAGASGNRAAARIRGGSHHGVYPGRIPSSDHQRSTPCLADSVEPGWGGRNGKAGPPTTTIWERFSPPRSPFWRARIRPQPGGGWALPAKSRRPSRAQPSRGSGGGRAGVGGGPTARPSPSPPSIPPSGSN